MAFADDFRTCVLPRLREACRREGVFVACRLRDFADAHAAIWEEAAYLGALFLPEPVRADLEDWIGTTLLHAVLAAEQHNAVLGAELAEQLSRDPVTYYEELAEACREPERMRWVFAAISPEYRQHLIASRRTHVAVESRDGG